MPNAVQSKYLLFDAPPVDPTVTFDNNFTDGNSIVIVFLARWNTQQVDGMVNSITNNKGHTIVKRAAVHRGYGDLYVEIWDCLGAADAVPATKITFTFDSKFVEGGGLSQDFAIYVCEMPDLIAFSQVGTRSGGDANSTSVSSLTPTLPSQPQVAFAGFASFASNVVQPSGWDALAINPNGSGGVASFAALKREYTSLAAVSASWSYDLSIYGAGAAIATYTVTAGASIRMKFLLDSATFNASDTAVEGFVWVNGWPDIVNNALHFNNLAGEASGGILYINDTHPNWPTGLVVGDQLKGVFYNGVDGCTLISGIVEAA